MSQIRESLKVSRTAQTKLIIDNMSSPKQVFFFIKNNHAFRNYKNHDYFESSAQHSSTGTCQLARGFVNNPTSFGINNAYHNVCTRLTQTRTQPRKIIVRNSKTQKQRRQNSLSDPEKRISAFLEERVPQTTQLAQSCSRRKLLTLPLLRTFKRYQTSLTDSLERVEVLRQLTIPPSGTSKPQIGTKVQTTTKSEWRVSLMFLSQQSQTGNTSLNIDVLPYLINTFRNCKMCYSELRQEDLATIVEAILLVSKTKKEDYPYHEIVNLSSIRSVMTKLGQLGKNSLDWRETVRYFFVADKQLLEYQLEQVKDELRRLTSAKLNSDVHDKELFIFSEQSGAPVLDLYDVLSSPSKLIFGPEKDIIQVYQQLQRQLLQHSRRENRLKKWRSITQSADQRAPLRSMPIQQYNRLFCLFKAKRQRLSRNRIKEVLDSRCQPFIDRAKLGRDEQIFE